MEVCPLLKPSKASAISGSPLAYVIPYASGLILGTRTCTEGRLRRQTGTDVPNILFMMNHGTSLGIKEEPCYKSSCRWRSLLPDRLRRK